MHNEVLKLLDQERSALLLKLQLLEQTILAFKTERIDLAQVLNAIQHMEGFDAAAEDRKALMLKYQDYNADEIVKKKVLKVIRTEGRFLHVREIVRIFEQLEAPSSEVQLIRSISPALSNLKRLPNSPLVSILVDNSHFNTFWGIKDWLTETGEVKNPYMFNWSEVRKHKALEY